MRHACIRSTGTWPCMVPISWELSGHGCIAAAWHAEISFPHCTLLLLCACDITTELSTVMDLSELHDQARGVARGSLVYRVALSLLLIRLRRRNAHISREDKLNGKRKLSDSLGEPAVLRLGRAAIKGSLLFSLRSCCAGKLSLSCKQSWLSLSVLVDSLPVVAKVHLRSMQVM